MQDFTYCSQRNIHYFLISIRHQTLTLPSSFHSFPSLSAWFSHLWLSPHYLSLCRIALSLIYHSTLPGFSPSPVLSSQLPSPLFLIISTLRLPLAFPYPLSLLPLRISSSLSHSAPAHCLPLAPLLIYHLFVSGRPGWTLHLVNK